MYTGMIPSVRPHVPVACAGVAVYLRPGAPRRQAGVTLIELMVVITVAAILLAVGIPTFKNITTSYRISGEINGLLGDMQFARAEAIKEGQSVTICVSPDGVSCSGASWQNGWTVFPNPTGALTAASSAPSVLRVQAAFSGSDTLV
ncbi:MAG TPA: GspH/FimT family pseudopilin, partial [Steroidobacteraceae bacterium]|nr:GspH/FimT family pseudopilin [Steroidobacteraceae bacterium]